MKVGIALGMLNPAMFESAVQEAERLGFESAWLPEHLVFPAEMHGSPHPGHDAPPVPPTTPVFDAFALLAYLAGRTERIRLGTHVYLLGLRHPFVAARAITTLDIVSRGRAEVGIGAGWLREEWTAVGLDPRTRGRRLDEALAICRRLFCEERIAHEGEFYRFPAVAFEPKPIQRPHPKIHVGGESPQALARAARAGDGWLGLAHDPASAGARVAELASLRRAAARERAPFEITIGALPRDRAELRAYEDAGVSRIIVSPWRRSREAIEALRRFADSVL